MHSNSGVRIMTGYGAKNTPATAAYNAYITKGLQAEDARRQSELVLENSAVGVQSDSLGHAETSVTMHRTA